MRNSSGCAVFLGAADLGDWERQELAIALDRSTKERKFRVFPVLLPGIVEPFDATTLSPFLSIRTWVDFRKGFEADRTFQDLIHAIKGIPFGPDLPLESSQDVCPYRGLQYFDESHAEFFFGRDADSQRLIEKIKTSKFLAVVGPSGSGKSSLVRAGLLPLIRQGTVLNSQNWDIRTIAPGAHPLTALASQILRLVDSRSMQDTLSQLEKDERSLSLAVSLALADKDSTHSLVLLVDQFEEVFTLCQSESERQNFLDNLVYASSVPGGRLIILITMRADFYQKCAAYPKFSAWLAAHQFLVSPMSLEDLRQAIEEPARRVGLEFEEGLVDTIVEDIEAQPGALPLLEHALLELWERRRQRMLTLEGYRESGGIEGAIAKRADTIFESFGVEQQGIVKKLMLLLTQPGEGTEDTRRRASRSQLIPTDDTEQSVNAVINAMVSARLLTTGGMEEASDESFVDVSHEALIRGWPKLQRWIEDDRDALREHHRLSEATQDWMKAEESSELLYRGPRLAQAVRLREQYEPLLNEGERAFLDASIQFQEDERLQKERRRTRTVMAVIITFVLISGAALWAFFERSRAEVQRDAAISRQLAASAQAQLQVDPELSLLLAMKAAETSPSQEAREALKASLRAHHQRAVYAGHDAEIWHAVFHPNGSKFVTASDDYTARIWSIPMRKELAVLPHKKIVTSVAVSPNGKWILTTCADATAQLWDFETGKPNTMFRGHQGSVIESAFSSDSRFAATVSLDGTAKVWDVEIGNLISTFHHHTSGVTYVQFSPDGTKVVTSSQDGTARIWDPHSGKELAVLRGHTEPIWMVRFSPNGQRVVTASIDHTARVWVTETGQLLHTLKTHLGKVNTARFSPDGQYIVTASNDQSAGVWKVETGELVGLLVGHSNLIYNAEFSADGNWIVTASFDGTARVWDWINNQTVAILRGHVGRVTSANFDPQGRWIVTTSRDQTARLWEVESLQDTHSIIREIYSGAATAEFSQDGQYLLIAGRDGIARIWDVSTRAMNLSLENHGGSLNKAIFHPTETMIATAGSDGTVKIWDQISGSLVSAFRGHDGGVNSVAFSLDGQWLVTAGQDASAIVWDWKTQKIFVKLEGHGGPVFDAAFSPDAQYIITASQDKSARIWERQTGNILRILTGHSDWVYSGRFSPGGQYVVTASGDKTTRNWNVVTGKVEKEFRGHAGPVFQSTLSPKEEWFLTASQDETAKLWDQKTGELLSTFLGHSEPINMAGFNPAGDLVVTASDDATVRVHRVRIPGTTQELLSLAEARATRDFSKEEGKTFFSFSEE